MTQRYGGKEKQDGRRGVELQVLLQKQLYLCQNCMQSVVAMQQCIKVMTKIQLYSSSNIFTVCVCVSTHMQLHPDALSSPPAPPLMCPHPSIPPPFPLPSPFFLPTFHFLFTYPLSSFLQLYANMQPVKVLPSLSFSWPSEGVIQCRGVSMQIVCCSRRQFADACRVHVYISVLHTIYDASVHTISVSCMEQFVPSLPVIFHSVNQRCSPLQWSCCYLPFSCHCSSEVQLATQLTTSLQPTTYLYLLLISSSQLCVYS